MAAMCGRPRWTSGRTSSRSRSSTRALGLGGRDCSARTRHGTGLTADTRTWRGPYTKARPREVSCGHFRISSHPRGSAREPVLVRRERARGVRRERAGRVVRLVEVERDRPVLRLLRVEEPPGAVRLRTVRLVSEDHEEVFRALFDHGAQADFLAVDREDGSPAPGTSRRARGSPCDLHFLRLLEGNPLRLDPELRVDVVPLDRRERLLGGRVRVRHPHPDPLSALDDVERDRADLDLVGFSSASVRTRSMRMTGFSPERASRPGREKLTFPPVRSSVPTSDARSSAARSPDARRSRRGCRLP